MARRWSIFSLSFATLMLLSAGARAQAGGDAAKLAEANALYQEATKAMDAKDYATACPKLEEVTKKAPQGIGARLTLAECYEGMGKLASAVESYKMASAMAVKAKQPDRQKLADKQVKALEPKLAKLTVDVSPGARATAGLEVRRDGALVDAATWGVPVAVDKGSTVVEARAPGKLSWTKKVEIATDGVAVTVVIKALEDANPLPVTPEPPAPKEAPSTGLGAQRIAGIVVGTTGLVSLGVGSALGLIAMQKKKESNDGPCHDGNHCNAVGVKLREDAITAANASTALFVVGGAALVTGVMLLAVAPKKKKDPSAAIRVGPTGVEVTGTW